MTLKLDGLLSHVEKNSMNEKSLPSLVSVCVYANKYSIDPMGKTY